MAVYDINKLNFSGNTYNIDNFIAAYPRNGATELSSTWLSESNGGSALTPRTGKIYVLAAASTNYSINTQFRWTGSAYVALTSEGNPGTVTSITAGTGLSGGTITSSGTINHSNSITEQTTQAVYPIKIDAQGHISAYGSAVTIPDISGKIDTAGTGLSKSGTTLNHSNSVTVQTTQAVYPIKIDAQGHISEYGTAISSKTAVSGGTDNSLVTTGEKYTWNQKQDALTAGTGISISNGVISLNLTIAENEVF